MIIFYANKNGITIDIVYNGKIVRRVGPDESSKFIDNHVKTK